MRVAQGVILATLMAGLAAPQVRAQGAGQSQQPSGAMQGFSINREQPVKIEANRLEVRDKIRQATFLGDVKLVQGEATLRCKKLIVFYEDPPPASKKGAQPAAAQGPGGGTQIKRAEAWGDVFIVQKDQTATGESGVFDLKSNTVTLSGKVVVSQGGSVLRGERMVVNLTTGLTTVVAGEPGQRVEMLTQPGAAKDVKATPAPAPAAKPGRAVAPPAAAKAAPRGPIRIN